MYLCTVIVEKEAKDHLFKKLEQDREAHSHHFYSPLNWKAQPWESDKKKKGIQIGREEVKLSVYVNDIILC